MEQKTCATCGKTQPITQFSLARNGTKQHKPVRKSKCKVCQADAAREWYVNNQERAKENRRRYQFKSKYGITIEEYEKLLKKQNGVCALCKKDESAAHGRTGTKFWLSVDHCHVFGHVRGLLCQKCNRAIGLFNDDPRLLRKAIAYLGGQ